MPQAHWDQVQQRIAARAEKFPMATSRSRTGRAGSPSTSPAAVSLAEQRNRRLHRERQNATRDKPGRNAGKVTKLDVQLAQLERLQAEGVCKPVDFHRRSP